MNTMLCFPPNETSFWETPLRIKEKASDRWENWMSGPNPAADFTRRPFFFSRGSPRSPLGRLGGDFPADGPPSSQPAWGDPPAPKNRRQRRALVFLYVLLSAPAAGVFLFCSAPAAGFCFFQNFRRLRRALFLYFFGACGGLLFFSFFLAPAAGSCFLKIFLRLRRALVSLSLVYLI